MKTFSELTEALDYFMIGKKTPFDGLVSAVKRLKPSEKKELTDDIENLMQKHFKRNGYDSFQSFIDDTESYISIKGQTNSISFNTKKGNRRKKVYGTVPWKEIRSLETYVRGNKTASQVVTISAALFMSQKPKNVFIVSQVRQSQKLENKSLKHLQKLLDNAFEMNDLKSASISIEGKKFDDVAKIKGDLPTQSKSDFIFLNEQQQKVFGVSLKDKNAVGYQFSVMTNAVQKWFSKSTEYKKIMSEAERLIIEHFKNKNEEIPKEVNWLDLDVNLAIRVNDEESRRNFIYGTDSNIHRADVFLKCTAGSEELVSEQDGSLSIASDGYALIYPSTKVKDEDDVFLVTRSETSSAAINKITVAGKKITLTQFYVGARALKLVKKVKNIKIIK